MQELLELQPVLVRISAAKRMRDQAERDARETGRSHVEAQRFSELFGQSTAGALA
jgi:chlorophyllide a reductase subunit Z